MSNDTIYDKQTFKSWLKSLVDLWDDYKTEQSDMAEAVVFADELERENWWDEIPDGVPWWPKLIRDVSWLNIGQLMTAWHIYASSMGVLQCCHPSCSKTFLAHDAQVMYCSRSCAARTYPDHMLFRVHDCGSKDVIQTNIGGNYVSNDSPETIEPHHKTFRGWLLEVKDKRRSSYTNKSSGQYLSDFTYHIAHDVVPRNDLGYEGYPGVGYVKLSDMLWDWGYSQQMKWTLVHAWFEYAEFIKAQKCEAPNCNKPVVSGSEKYKYCSDECAHRASKTLSREYHRQRQREKLNSALKRIVKEADTRQPASSNTDRESSHNE